jgi:multisubunit Na+/H+ antiporter MnhG subunit
MMKGYFIIIFGLFFLLLGLLGLLSLNNSFNPIDLMLCVLGLF